jgi:hypothetical protein
MLLSYLLWVLIPAAKHERRLLSYNYKGTSRYCTFLETLSSIVPGMIPVKGNFLYPIDSESDKRHPDVHRIDLRCHVQTCS